MTALNYGHLRCFHAIAEAGGVTEAARRLNVSPSSLSIQLRQLEQQLGHPLFDRVGRGLRLTEAGRIALDRAKAIFRAGDELVHTLKGRGGSALRVLRVGAVANLSRNFQIAALRRVLAEPDVEVVLRSAPLPALLADLEALRLDVVLANVPPARDAATAWISHAIAEQPVSLVGHPRHRQEGAGLRAALTAAPLILPSAESSLRGALDALFDRLGVTPRIAAEVDDMAMLRLLAREDVGLATVPPIVVTDELASGRLAELASLAPIAEQFHAITLRRRFPNPLVATLIEAARALGRA
jgi:LysR family transcriptional activator of nhaA